MVTTRTLESGEPAVRRRCITAATQLFAAQGFDGTSVQAIADALGVTKQAVLHHFASKEALREAVLAAMLDHWRDTLPRLLVAASASDERFDSLFGELHRFFVADPDRARLLVRELLDRPDAIRRLLRETVRPWLGAVAGYIRDGQARGLHYADVDPEAYLIHVLSLVLTAAAGAHVSAVALAPGATGRARFHAELARIARASLFLPPATPAAGLTPAPAARRRPAPTRKRPTR
jgi:AcrR family transcriptional regulator